jgi:uncharacterized membrane protein (UPF0182 family)
MIKRAIIIVVGIAVLSFLMNGAANWLEIQPSSSDQKFSVVDTYKGCDVIQYTPTNAARYTYFLDCKK